MPKCETGAKHIPSKHEIDLVVDAKCVCAGPVFVCAVPPHLGLAMGSAAKHGMVRRPHRNTRLAHERRGWGCARANGRSAERCVGNRVLMQAAAAVGWQRLGGARSE